MAATRLLEFIGLGRLFRKWPIRTILPAAIEDSENHVFRFLDLPLEIRRMIYEAALPSDPELSKRPLGLLCANRQISHEVHECLYRDKKFTVTIDPIGLPSDICFKRDPFRFHLLPFRDTVMQHIKSWELYIRFSGYQRSIPSICLAPSDPALQLEHSWAYVYNALHGIARELSICEDLQILKLKMPCLCLKRGWPRDRDNFVAETIELVKSVLLPLGQLRFKGSVVCMTGWDLVLESGYPDLGLLTKLRRNQCEEKNCLEFAQALSSFLNGLVGPHSLMARGDYVYQYGMDACEVEVLRKVVVWGKVEKRNSGF